MPTIVDVAKRAGVSIATVSNVIRSTARVSTTLRERVEAAIEELQYHPNEIARSLKVRQTCMIAMVQPDITNPFFPEIIRGAEDKAFECGYLLLTANTDEQIAREQEVFSTLRSRRVDGILLAPASGTNSVHIQSAIEAGIAVVCVDRAVPSVKTDAVLLNNARGSFECLQHMIQAGYKSIAIITGDLKLQTAKERLQGYKRALRAAGLEIRDDLIVEGDFRQESGYRLAKELLQRTTRPSAIFVCNGVMTLGVLKAFEELRVRCPADIGLATFDDFMEEMAFHPHLTTVVQPSYEIGKRAATMLIDRVEGKLTGEPLTVRISPALIQRETTKRP
ncbi:LacI family DNA-binding transcriptional regulator [Acidicapsa ligni]|uniref:LacI family DNA-binding transcriptional regulator n=1 Tax=Acidicapsa ligni TaxID=542300 RepID=UPI0021E0D85F|nr:LacI family DNA-binding transcriptional regulator [Acidicapsa ligni]